MSAPLWQDLGRNISKLSNLEIRLSQFRRNLESKDPATFVTIDPEEKIFAILKRKYDVYKKKNDELRVSIQEYIKTKEKKKSLLEKKGLSKGSPEDSVEVKKEPSHSSERPPLCAEEQVLLSGLSISSVKQGPLLSKMSSSSNPIMREPDTSQTHNYCSIMKKLLAPFFVDEYKYYLVLEKNILITRFFVLLNQIYNFLARYEDMIGVYNSRIVKQANFTRNIFVHYGSFLDQASIDNLFNQIIEIEEALNNSSLIVSTLKGLLSKYLNSAVEHIFNAVKASCNTLVPSNIELAYARFEDKARQSRMPRFFSIIKELKFLSFPASSIDQGDASSSKVDVSLDEKRIQYLLLELFEYCKADKLIYDLVSKFIPCYDLSHCLRQRNYLLHGAISKLEREHVLTQSAPLRSNMLNNTFRSNMVDKLINIEENILLQPDFSTRGALSSTSMFQESHRVEKATACIDGKKP